MRGARESLDRGSVRLSLPRLPLPSSPLLISAIALATLASQATRLSRSGLCRFGYDEFQYARRALELRDAIATGAGSVFSIAAHQRGAKPPLLEDLLASALLLLGREAVLGATLLVLLLGSAACLLLTWRLVSEAFSRLAGALAVLLVSASPAYLFFGARLYPEVLVVAAWLATMLLLFQAAERWGFGRILLLGILLGLGSLAKLTFLALVIGPLAVWLVVGGGGLRTVPERARALLLAAAVAVLIGAPWFVPNLTHALRHARVAYRFPAGGGSQWPLLLRWSEALLWDGLGLFGAALALLAAVRFAAAPRRLSSALDRRQLALLAACLAASVAVLAPALSSANVSIRLVLPALVPLLVAAAPLAVAEPSRRGVRLVRRAIVLALVLQWLGFLIVGAMDPPARWVRSVLEPMVPPFLHAKERSCDRISGPSRAVVELARSVAATAPGAKWLLVTAYPEMNSARLNFMVAREGGGPEFDAASAFLWKDRTRARVLARAASTRSIIVDYQRTRPLRGRLVERNRYAGETRAFVARPENGFRLWRRLDDPNGRYTIALYANFAPAEVGRSSGPRHAAPLRGQPIAAIAAATSRPRRRCPAGARIKQLLISSST
jgi:hypothetical protein